MCALKFRMLMYGIIDFILMVTVIYWLLLRYLFVNIHVMFIIFFSGYACTSFYICFCLFDL